MHLIGPLLCEEHLLALLGAATLSAKRKVQDGFECNEKTLHTHFRKAESVGGLERKRQNSQLSTKRFLANEKSFSRFKIYTYNFSFAPTLPLIFLAAASKKRCERIDKIAILWYNNTI